MPTPADFARARFHRRWRRRAHLRRLAVCVTELVLVFASLMRRFESGYRGTSR